MYNPSQKFVGGYTPNDGTIEFYLRINSLITSDSVVLDLGAGRGQWFEDDKCSTRKAIRTMHSKVKEFIAADIDTVVLENRASHRQLVIVDGIDLPDTSIDVIIADYILEHIDDASQFASEVDRLLMPGGWLCARTPHKHSYVALAARLVSNKYHSSLLKYIQPKRKEIDVFPTTYALNMHKDVKKVFPQWNDYTYIYKTDPSYYFGKKWLYFIQKYIQHLLFKHFSGNLFIFIQKPENNSKH
jgi:SAM-dependent methyltransferase